MSNLQGEAAVIARAQGPVALNDLIDGIRQAGLNAGDTVLVHSSLSRLGWVVGGPQTVLEALRAGVGQDGTLVMPAFSGQLSDPGGWVNPPVPPEWVQGIRDAMPLFDPDLTAPRGMGAVVAAFRAVPGTVRSHHPHDSFFANGPTAAALMSDHPLTNGLGPEGPLGRLYDMSARVLMLGTDYDSCSCFHLAEYHPKVPVNMEQMPVRKDGDKTVWAPVENTTLNTVHFAKFGPALEATGRVLLAKNLPIRGFKLRDAVDAARAVITMSTD